MSELSMAQRAFLLTCEAEGVFGRSDLDAIATVRLVEGLAVRALVKEAHIRLDAALHKGDGVEEAICYADALALVLHVELGAGGDAPVERGKLCDLVRKWIELRGLPAGRGPLI